MTVYSLVDMEDPPVGAARFPNADHGYYNQTDLEDALSAAQQCKVLLIHFNLNKNDLSAFPFR
jgi:hypothetical protein